MSRLMYERDCSYPLCAEFKDLFTSSFIYLAGDYMRARETDKECIHS